jgi:peroxiredoxin
MGRDRTLAELMGKNGTVVFFVRSVDWCPYCQRQVIEVNERLDDFQALDLNVVSVSVDDVEEIAEFADLHNIQLTMLADPAGAINESLGIRDHQYPVGTNAFGVPRPVLYVVDSDNTIRLRYMEPTYRTRPDLDSVLRDAIALGF